MNSWVRFKSYISFLLISLMTCNALLSATGGILLHFHHDLSFHFAADVVSVETVSHFPTVAKASDHSNHHHHEIELIAEVGPTLRGNTFDRVQAPILVVAMNLFDSNLALPVRSMRGGSAIRPPPEATPNYLAPLRTQVLRL
jgi:hypothetical protein